MVIQPGSDALKHNDCERGRRSVGEVTHLSYEAKRRIIGAVRIRFELADEFVFKLLAPKGRLFRSLGSLVLQQIEHKVRLLLWRRPRTPGHGAEATVRVEIERVGGNYDEQEDSTSGG